MSDIAGRGPDPAGAPTSVWQRRIVAPVLGQLRQGITPEKIALTIALGAVLAVFPILGSTTLLCGLAAWALRLNQPIIQLVNYLCYPLQFALLIPFWRAGEWFGAPHVSLSIPELARRFEAAPWPFLVEFAGVAAGGIAAWLLLAPPAAVLLRVCLLPVLRRAALRSRRPA